jgi:hypothetical protein
MRYLILAGLLGLLITCSKPKTFEQRYLHYKALCEAQGDLKTAEVFEGLFDKRFAIRDYVGGKLYKILKPRDSSIVDLKRAIESDYPMVRACAVEYIPILKTKKYNELIFGLLDDPNLHVAAAAADALGRFKEKSAVPALKRKIVAEDSHRWESSYAFNALKEISDRPFTKDEWIGLRNNPRLTSEALDIAKMLAKDGDEDAVKYLIDAIVDTSYYWLKRERALKAAGELGMEKAVPNAKKIFLKKNEHVRVRIAAYDALEKLKSTKGVLKCANPNISLQDGIPLLTWKNQKGAVYYKVYKQTEDGRRPAMLKEKVRATSFLDVFCEKGKGYKYRIAFVNKKGLESAPSDLSGAVKAEKDGIERDLDKVKTKAPVKTISNAYGPLPEGMANIHCDVVVGDLNNDRQVDFIVHDRVHETKRAFLFDGTLLWERPYYYYHSPVHDIRSVVGDFDEDNKNDVALLEHEGLFLNVVILDALTGKIKNQRSLKSVLNGNYEIRDDILCGDTKGTGKNQTIIIHHNCYSSVEVVALDKDLDVVWKFSTPHSSPHRMLVEDLDGDGRDEFVLSHETIDHNGGLMGRAPSIAGSHADGVRAGDFDPRHPGLEVAVAGCNHDNVYLLDINMHLLWVRFDGHAQWLTFGDFAPDRDGLELVVNFRSSRGFVWLLDARGEYIKNTLFGRPDRIDWDGDPKTGTKY